MPILLDHTIVPARDKLASAKFFAEIFGLNVKPGGGVLCASASQRQSDL